MDLDRRSAATAIIAPAGTVATLAEVGRRTVIGAQAAPVRPGAAKVVAATPIQHGAAAPVTDRPDIGRIRQMPWVRAQATLAVPDLAANVAVLELVFQVLRSTVAIFGAASIEELLWADRAADADAWSAIRLRQRRCRQNQGQKHKFRQRQHSDGMASLEWTILRRPLGFGTNAKNGWMVRWGSARIRSHHYSGRTPAIREKFDFGVISMRSRRRRRMPWKAGKQRGQ